MSSTPKGFYEESIIDADSWEEVSQAQVNPVSYFSGSSFEKILLDAQKEGSESSVSSRLRTSEGEDVSEDGRSLTPSPTASDDCHPGLNVLSTQSGVAQRKQGSTDWIWDWSSRPDIIHPPKKWQLKHPSNSSLSVDNSLSWKEIFFRKDVISVLLISNLVTFLFAVGCVEVFLSRRTGSGFIAKVLK